jgi:hypothetical protein
MYVARKDAVQPPEAESEERDGGSDGFGVDLAGPSNAGDLAGLGRLHKRPAAGFVPATVSDILEETRSEEDSPALVSLAEGIAGAVASSK